MFCLLFTYRKEAIRSAITLAGNASKSSTTNTIGLWLFSSSLNLLLLDVPSSPSLAVVAAYTDSLTPANNVCAACTFILSRCQLIRIDMVSLWSLFCWLQLDSGAAIYHSIYIHMCIIG